jgi:hypothetical protein
MDYIILAIIVGCIVWWLATGFTVPFFVWILGAVIAYIIAGWITVGIYSETNQGMKFSDDELFGLGVVWPLVALKGLLYVLFRSTKGSASAVRKLFSTW